MISKKEINQEKPKSRSRSKSKIKKILAWLGIHLHILPKFYLTLLIIVLGLLAAFTGLYFYSTSPSFCSSCHIPKPYWDA